MTGLVFKPIFGWLSDRWGRTFWLFLGLALFSGMPFFYQLIESPEQLFFLRLIHGLATAIFGPVTLALVAEMAVSGRAERLGWFGMARSSGYLLAPILGAWLLTWLEPQTVFTIIGFLSCTAFLPVFMMDRLNLNSPKSKVGKQKIMEHGFRACVAVIPNRGLWLAAVLETLTYFFIYSIKVFLPLYALHTADFNLLTVGIFFTVQEVVHLCVRPLGGGFGDRFGYLKSINVGYLGLVIGLLFLPHAVTEIGLLAVAVVIGASQGFVLPSTVALAGGRLDADYLGAGMGLLGAMRNCGKVAGPFITGALLIVLDYSKVFHLGGITALIIVISFFVLQRKWLKGMFTNTQLTEQS
jgi:MFS family permease